VVGSMIGSIEQPLIEPMIASIIETGFIDMLGFLASRAFSSFSVIFLDAVVKRPSDQRATMIADWHPPVSRSRRARVSRNSAYPPLADQRLR
jgi:hypothetical protein